MSDYDDAWDTPGWNAQTRNYFDDADPAEKPVGLRKVPVTGRFADDRNRGMHGTVTFTPSVRTVRAGSVAVFLRTIRGRYVAGKFMPAVALTFPDIGATTVDPPAWTYSVRQRIGVETIEYTISPPTGTEINLLDVMTLDSDTTITDEFPLRRDFEVYAGATFRREYVWARSGGADFTTWTARLQIRASVGGNLLLELTETSGITLGANGEIALLLTAEQTAALANGVYDLELYEPGGDTTRFLEGSVTVSPNVTV